MLVKDFYCVPGSNFDLVELPDGSLYKINICLGRDVTMDDLVPVDLRLPKSVYLSSVSAIPYLPGLRGLQAKIFGFTFSD